MELQLPKGQCVECNEPDQMLDPVLVNTFDVNVCISCKASVDPGKRSRSHTKQDPSPKNVYGCLSQSEAQEYYLVTKEMLSRLSFIEKPNPHNQKFAPLKLYLRLQVQELSYAKFNGSDGLTKAKKDRQVKQFTLGAKRTGKALQQAKKRSRINKAVEQRLATAGETHVHEYEDEVYLLEKDCWMKNAVFVNWK